MLHSTVATFYGFFSEKLKVHGFWPILTKPFEPTILTHRLNHNHFWPKTQWPTNSFFRAEELKEIKKQIDHLAKAQQRRGTFASKWRVCVFLLGENEELETAFIDPPWHPGSRRKAAPNILQAWRLWWCVSESAEARLHVPDRTLESLYTVGNTPSTQSNPKSSSAVVAIFVSLWCGNSGSFVISPAFRVKGAKRERTVWIESLWRWVGCAAATRVLRSSWPQQRWRFWWVLSPTRGWTQER